MSKVRKLTHVDLFAGSGGLSLGLEEAGFVPLAFSEISPEAAATYATNRQEWSPVQFGDVSGMTDRTLDGLGQQWRSHGIRNVDLVCGGPPCQGYSGIGHRRTHRVERIAIPSNHLYLEMIRVIRAVRPKMFLFENVKGLLTGRWTASGERGEIWRDVRRAFGDIPGYDVRDALVQAKDYGVPQNRPRVLVVGIRRDLGWRPSIDGKAVADGLLPLPTGECAPDLIDVLGDLVDPDFGEKLSTTNYLHPARGQFQRRIRTRRDGRLLKKGDPLWEHEYARHSEQVRRKFEYMLAHKGKIAEKFRTKKFAQRLLPKRWEDGGPTITATSLPDDFVHYCQPRILTVREWARLQCFPDWYAFRGRRTTGGHRRAGRALEGNWEREVPKYTQIGNAVPVRLARAIGLHLAEILNS